MTEKGLLEGLEFNRGITESQIRNLEELEKSLQAKITIDSITAITGLMSIGHIHSLTPEVKEKANAKLIKLLNKL